MRYALFLLMSLSAAAAQARPAALDVYLQQLKSVEQATRPVSLERLFAAADEVQAAIMQLENGQVWLETLSDEEYSALQIEMRGFVLHRGYDVYAQPDPDFLLKLAEAHGREVDQAFFILYRQYWTGDFMPVFQRQGDNPTPCVRFGEGVIAEVYEAWLGFVRRYPGTYKVFAPQVVADAEEIVSLGTCTCGDARGVLAEQAVFLKRFPKTPVADTIRARMKQLREDPDKLPVRCR